MASGAMSITNLAPGATVSGTVGDRAPTAGRKREIILDDSVELGLSYGIVSYQNLNSASAFNELNNMEMQIVFDIGKQLQPSFGKGEISGAGSDPSNSAPWQTRSSEYPTIYCDGVVVQDEIALTGTAPTATGPHTETYDYAVPPSGCGPQHGGSNYDVT
ncbi:MAG: hypothetical protein JO020_02655 [Chloroflexi bacterium]|nr:hypothetical protein [Chloroflexota bacterium]MBV9893050.1 hypothetical protein [Chloroflexota bacterium]